MHPIVFILLLLVGVPIVFCALIALFAALMLLLPDPIRQARINLEEHPWRSIFLGVLNFTGVAIMLVLLTNLADNNWRLQSVIMPLVVLIAMIIAVPAVIGLCAVIIIMGNRLGVTSKPLYTYLRGGGLLLLACLFPFIGWFVFTPLVLWASMGSVIGTLVKPKVTEVPHIIEPLHD